MGFGVPVVATSLAVEGMALTDHEEVLVADEPENFERALIELYESEELWSRLSENSIKMTKARYSVAAARKGLSYSFSDEHIHAARGRELKILTSKMEPTSDGSPESLF
jgi:glycosyltransferase involved in cell wall biosynthesis